MWPLCALVNTLGSDDGGTDDRLMYGVSKATIKGGIVEVSGKFFMV